MYELHIEKKCCRLSINPDILMGLNVRNETFSIFCVGKHFF